MLSACILARNEEAYLDRLLSSLTACPEINLLDTGSTDGTLAIAARHPAVRVHNFQWVDDFSAARNAATRLASHGWVMWLDADMWFPPGELEKVLTFLPRVPGNVDAINFKVRDEAGTLPSPRLYRSHLRFHGTVHEQLDAQMVMQTPFLLHHQRHENEASLRGKDQRYARMLLAELQADPDSLHALMYLRDLAFKAKDHGRARDYIARMLCLQDDYLNPYLLACMAFEEGQPEQAAVHAFEALRLCALDPRVYRLIGDAYDDLGRKVEALVFYEHALRLPEEARLIGTKYAIAEEDYSVVPLVNKAKVYADLGLKEKALGCYGEALRRQPETRHRSAIERNQALLGGT